MSSTTVPLVPLAEAHKHEALSEPDRAPEPSLLKPDSNGARAGAAPSLFDVDDVLARTQEQLRQGRELGRELADKARKLTDTTQEQASTAEALAHRTDRLVGEARTMLNRVEALASEDAVLYPVSRLVRVGSGSG
jgi:hypothetical protein